MSNPFAAIETSLDRAVGRVLANATVTWSGASFGAIYRQVDRDAAGGSYGRAPRQWVLEGRISDFGVLPPARDDVLGIDGVDHVVGSVERQGGWVVYSVSKAV